MSAEAHADEVISSLRPLSPTRSGIKGLFKRYWDFELILALAVVLWLPRLSGPIDLRYDAGVYYLLGTSLAQGHGYRIPSEPGSPQALQYPPLLPAIVATYQRALGTSDPLIIGPGCGKPTHSSSLVTPWRCSLWQNGSCRVGWRWRPPRSASSIIRRSFFPTFFSRSFRLVFWR